jgi:anti-sigma B factor antagonist
MRNLLRNVLHPRASVVPISSDDEDDVEAPAFSMQEFPFGPGRVRVSVSGVIDLRCRDDLRNRLLAMIAIDHVDDLLIDLDLVEFLDCSGIGALVAGRKAANAAGSRFQVRNPRGVVATVMELTGAFTPMNVDTT